MTQANMPPKHPRPRENREHREQDAPSRAKRQRLFGPTSSSSHASSPSPIRPRSGTDLLSPLSDELLVRILSYLSLPQLLSLAPVSRRFHRLAEDSQLWKALYYARFVLPRAMRIPGFREGMMNAARMRDHKLHYKGRRTLWADGRLGGLVREAEIPGARGPRAELTSDDGEPGAKHHRVNWKRQYKTRHNWARGKCAVEELKLGAEPQDGAVPGADVLEEDGVDGSKILVKVVEGVAVTADRSYGLRAWDLKTREVMAQIDLQDAAPGDEAPPPSCLAIDDRNLDNGALDISVGFTDGSFGFWRLQMRDKSLVQRYRHEKSSNGELMGMSYSHPYLLTATGAVLISLYTFDVPKKPGDGPEEEEDSTGPPPTPPKMNRRGEEVDKATIQNGISLPPPYLITSLKSHTSNPPLSLSIRRMPGIAVASIAYTFFTRQGWSIGIQDLQITPNDNPQCAPNITTRLAYTTPFHTSRPVPQTMNLPRTSVGPSTITLSQDSSSTAASSPSRSTSTPAPPRDQSGPTTLSYTHPYLLATLPDNTLILHLCTSNASTLSVSPGIRLWGHTSGISDAEITARGKAVSVSSRGEEMRVWELEGKPSGVRSRSVEIRPGSGNLFSPGDSSAKEALDTRRGLDGADWEGRRNWVGFDDEMVIVLKEARGRRESLLVYDFT